MSNHSDHSQDDGLRAWRAIRELTNAFLGLLDRELEAGAQISVREYQALLLLANGDPRGIRMADLANRIVLSRSAITALVDRIQGEGLVERTPDPADRRGTLVIPTSAGRRRFETAMAIHDRVIADHFSSQMSGGEAGLILAVLGRVAASAHLRDPVADPADGTGVVPGPRHGR